MNPYTAMINQGKRMLGVIAGANYTFTIGRPPYTQGDNTPVVVGTGSFHIEPAGPNWAVDKIPDVEFYEVCGDTDSFQEGDLIWGGAQTPRVTVFSKIEGQEFLAIKTDKPCRIEDITLGWENLYFDYMNSTSAGPEDEYREPTSLNNPVRRVVMIDLPEVTEAMKFFDDQIGWNWAIAKVDRKFNIMTLFLDQPNRT